MILSADQLKYIAPLIKPQNLDIYVPLLNKYTAKYKIDTKQRLAPFLANCAEESSSFNDTLENANPGHKPGEQYEGRADLGNIVEGDGVKFPGRGLGQLTGRKVYHDCSLALYGNLDLLVHPELLEQPDAATESACWFWAKVKNLNEIADLPSNWIHPGPHQYTKFQFIVVRINGGLNGYSARYAFLKRCLEIL